MKKYPSFFHVFSLGGLGVVACGFGGHGVLVVVVFLFL